MLADHFLQALGIRQGIGVPEQAFEVFKPIEHPRDALLIDH